MLMEKTLKEILLSEFGELM